MGETAKLCIGDKTIELPIVVGSEGERETLLNLARLVDEGERYGLPVLAVTAVGREMARDARYLGLACRIAAEIGAHFVKTYYCPGFEEIVRATPVPLVIAGGKKVPEKDAVLLAGAAGTVVAFALVPVLSRLAPKGDPLPPADG